MGEEPLLIDQLNPMPLDARQKIDLAPVKKVTDDIRSACNSARMSKHFDERLLRASQIRDQEIPVATAAQVLPEIRVLHHGITTAFVEKLEKAC
jgi:hypothetical protein